MVLRELFSEKRDFLGKYHRKIKNENESKKGTRRNILLLHIEDEARKRIIQKWQENRKQLIMHPFLKERVQTGLLPYAQAMLLARFLRGDMDAYPPYFKR